MEQNTATERCTVSDPRLYRNQHPGSAPSRIRSSPPSRQTFTYSRWRRSRAGRMRLYHIHSSNDRLYPLDASSSAVRSSGMRTTWRINWPTFKALTTIIESTVLSAATNRRTRPEGLPGHKPRCITSAGEAIAEASISFRRHLEQHFARYTQKRPEFCEHHVFEANSPHSRLQAPDKLAGLRSLQLGWTCFGARPN